MRYWTTIFWHWILFRNKLCLIFTNINLIWFYFIIIFWPNMCKNIRWYSQFSHSYFVKLEKQAQIRIQTHWFYMLQSKLRKCLFFFAPFSIRFTLPLFMSTEHSICPPPLHTTKSHNLCEGLFCWCERIYFSSFSCHLHANPIFFYTNSDDLRMLKCDNRPIFINYCLAQLYYKWFVLIN